MSVKSVVIVPLYVPAVAQNSTVYTSGEDRKPVRFRRLAGNAAMWIKTTGGSITVTQQVSLNGKEWHDAVDNSGNALGSVCSARTQGTYYIKFTPVLAPFVRFKIVEGNVGSSTVTAKLIFEEEL